MPALFVLYETAAGFSLFEVIGLDELGQSAEAVQQSTLDLTRFGKVWCCSCSGTCRCAPRVWPLGRVLDE